MPPSALIDSDQEIGLQDQIPANAHTVHTRCRCGVFCRCLVRNYYLQTFCVIVAFATVWLLPAYAIYKMLPTEGYTLPLLWVLGSYLSVADVAMTAGFGFVFFSNKLWKDLLLDRCGAEENRSSLSFWILLWSGIFYIPSTVGAVYIFDSSESLAHAFQNEEALGSGVFFGILIAIVAGAFVSILLIFCGKAIRQCFLNCRHQYLQTANEGAKNADSVNVDPPRSRIESEPNLDPPSHPSALSALVDLKPKDPFGNLGGLDVMDAQTASAPNLSDA